MGLSFGTGKKVRDLVITISINHSHHILIKKYY
jgi:hypothetical protein